MQAELTNYAGNLVGKQANGTRNWVYFSIKHGSLSCSYIRKLLLIIKVFIRNDTFYKVQLRAEISIENHNIVSTFW